MPKYIYNPVNTFKESVPDEFLVDTVQCVCECYLEAYQECVKFPRWERHDVRSHYRRALIEYRWRDVASRHKGVSAKAVPNKIGSAYHTEITIGNVVLVESFVDSPQSVVRPAAFRQTLTMEYQPLFEQESQESLEEEGLFGILLHGASDERTPRFAHIVFPVRIGDGYHFERVDLFDWFADVVKSKTSFQEELVPDEIEPELRENVTRTGTDS